MLQIGQKGIAHILLLILLVAGIALGIYLVQTRTNILPHAASDPIGPKTGFTLTSFESVPPGGEFYAKVIVNSDFDAANLFTLVLNYPADKVEFLSVSPSLDEKPAAGTFIKKWIEQTDDKNGTVILSGAVPNPGFQTSAGNPASMAVINFKVKPDLGGLPNGDIPLIVSDESGIYRNSDNQNIIGTNEGTTIKIGAQSSVAPRFVKITSPNGGETLEPGGVYKIQWDSNDVDTCELGYSFGEGSLNNIIKIPNQGYYDWAVNIGNSVNTRVKIDILCYKTGVGSVGDQSDDFFTVTPGDSSPSPSPSPTPVPVDGKRADLYNDPKKPNFVNDQDVSVFFSKCAEEGVELFGQLASVQPVCDINDDGTINTPDWAILIKFRNKQI